MARSSAVGGQPSRSVIRHWAAIALRGIGLRPKAEQVQFILGRDLRPQRTTLPSYWTIDITREIRIRISSHLRTQMSRKGHLKYITPLRAELIHPLFTYSNDEGIKLVLLVVGAKDSEIEFLLSRYRGSATISVITVNCENDVESHWLHFQEEHKGRHENALFAVAMKQ